MAEYCREDNSNDLREEDMGVKFSIIIPVYNAEKYIKQCVKSIMDQSYNNFEVLLIDDGALDCSGEICDVLAKEDQRIRVFHQKNRGTSGARNTGLKMAVGEYVMFMDNDDYWNSRNVLEQLSVQIKERQSDVIMFNNCTYWETSKKILYGDYKVKREAVLKSVNPVLYIIQNGEMSRAVWNKIIRRDIIIQNDLWFKENIRNEDTDWTAHLIEKAEVYDWCEMVFYTYRKGHISAQTSGEITYKIWKDLKNIIVETVNDTHKLSETKKEAILNYISYPYAVCMGQIGLIRGGGLKSDIKELKRYKFLILKSKDPYVIKIKYCYRIFGWNITAKMISLYIKTLQ